jgi:hypothetical protein
VFIIKNKVHQSLQQIYLTALITLLDGFIPSIMQMHQQLATLAPDLHTLGVDIS